MLTNYVSSSLVACFTASWECLPFSLTLNFSLSLSPSHSHTLPLYLLPTLNRTVTRSLAR